VTLRLAGSHSLKEKRQVVRSLLERVRRRYNAAVAEVDEQDSWQTAVIGIAVVSGRAAHADQQLARVLEFIEGMHLDAEVVDSRTEVIPA
jgi:uncharacterized protein YlxP (DUF503 family)